MPRCAGPCPASPSRWWRGWHGPRSETGARCNGSHCGDWMAPMTTTSPAFTGFQPEAIHFLLELSVHNDRSWFQPRKEEYERLLKEPFESLCLALGEKFAERGIPLVANERSPFRIYRDVRFSKDKSPYKTHLAASFPL